MVVEDAACVTIAPFSSFIYISFLSPQAICLTRSIVYAL